MVGHLLVHVSRKLLLAMASSLAAFSLWIAPCWCSAGWWHGQRDGTIHFVDELHADRSCLPCLHAGDDGGLKVQEIDAYWLQRRISQTLSNLDEHSAQKLAQEVLEALQVGHRHMDFNKLG
jgi:hypothetical protein